MKPESAKLAAAAEKQRRSRGAGAEEQRRGGSVEARYLGVRKRQWGKWVSEIRLPRSRERIWLGSYDAPEKAARAFDAAAFCLRGTSARLNFPDQLPTEFTTAAASNEQIQAAAARHASNQPQPATEEAAPEKPALVGEEFLFAHDDFWYELHPVAAGNRCRERPAAAAGEEDLEAMPDNQEKLAPEKSMEVRADYPIAFEDYFSDVYFPVAAPPPDGYEDRIEILDEFPTLWSF